MIEVGGGHKSIGLAIRDAIERQYPGEYEMAVVDFPRACGAVHMDRWIKSFWSMALAHPVAVFAREKFRLDCRIVSHVNDPFRANSLWVNPLADEVIVCSEHARKHMLRLGQPPVTMTVMPFPINSRFFDPISRTREEILLALGLDPKRMTVLASSGGEGIGFCLGYRIGESRPIIHAGNAEQRLSGHDHPCGAPCRTGKP